MNYPQTPGNSSPLTNDSKGHPERIIPDETASGIVAIHLKRYDFARDYVINKRVLDVACGVGYGSRYLADVATSMIGVDIDAAAIKYAKIRYGDSDNIRFMEGDALNLPFRDGEFDVVCSFETIEHVPDAQRFLSEVQRLLVPGGILIVSTPAAKRTTFTPANPHHVQEWSPRDFEALLSNYFDAMQIYSQVRRATRLARLIKRVDIFRLRSKMPLWFTRQVASSTGTRTMADVNMTDIEVVPRITNDASEILAVCIKHDEC